VARFSDGRGSHLAPLCPATLNPYQIGSFQGVDIDQGLFEGLFTYNSKLHLVPVMAAEIPSPTNGGILDGGRTVIVHLKRGLHWSNNSEITSADIRFGWQVDSDPATGPFCAGTCDVIRSVQTQDRYTAVLRLKRPDPALLSTMPHIWPAHWPGAWNGSAHDAARKLALDPSFDFLSSKYPTDGPYQVAQVVRNSRIVLRPMPYYDDLTCGGYLQEVVYTHFSSAVDMIAGAAAHLTDITFGYGLMANLLPELDQHRDVFAVHVLPGLGYEHLTFNVDPSYGGRPNPLADIRVRLALALALHKRILTQRAQSLPAPAAARVEAWTPWINTPGVRQPYADPRITGQWDPIAGHFVSDTGTEQALRDARRLLTHTRWSHGFTLDYVSPGGPAREMTANQVGTDWARLGVHLSSSAPDTIFNGWDQGGVLAHGAFQVADSLNGYSIPEPDQFRIVYQSRYIDRRASVHNSNVNQNWGGVRDRVIDRAFDIAGRTFNRKVRAHEYALIQFELNEKAYEIPLYFRPEVTTSDGRIAGFSPSPTTIQTWNIYAWHLASRHG
jgi:ABC-type transport system substrate-binding protein